MANAAEGRFSANGNLELQNYFSLDGIDNNTGSENLQEQSAQAVIPPPDALQEFALQTRTYSTEFGTSAGAVVNVSTKSGTNAFHGDLWDYIENSALNANTWFNNYGGVPKGHFSKTSLGRPSAAHRPQPYLLFLRLRDLVEPRSGDGDFPLCRRRR